MAAGRGRRTVTDLMSEARLLTTIREMCTAMGLLAYHTHDSRRSDPGFPDVVAVGPGGVLFRELKTATGVVSPTQQAWLEALRRAGMDADVWRPADLASLRITTELRRIRQPRPVITIDPKRP